MTCTKTQGNSENVVENCITFSTVIDPFAYCLRLIALRFCYGLQ